MSRHLYTNNVASGNARVHFGDFYGTHYYNITYPGRRAHSESHYDFFDDGDDDSLQDTTRNRALLKAAAEGQIKRVVHFIGLAANLSYTDEKGWTALHHAAVNNFVDIVKVLLEAGANIDADSEGYGTPLSLAISQKGLPCVRFLLESGASVNISGSLLGSAIHVACASKDLELLQHLLNHQSLRKTTWPTLRRTVDMRVLCDLFPDIGKDIEDTSVCLQCEPVHIAAMFGNAAMLEMLAGAQADMCAVYSSWSYDDDNDDPAMKRLDSRDFDCNDGTALMVAAFARNAETLLALIRYKLPVNAHSSDGMTALAHAVMSGADSCISTLLDNGADVHQAIRGGTTPLMLAVSTGDDTSVSLLLERKARPGDVDTGLRTALHVAARSGFTACVSMLVNSGAMVDCVDQEGRTPLSFAAENAHVEAVRLLLSLGASPIRSDSNGRHPIHYGVQADSAAVLKMMALYVVNTHDKDNMTPVDHAVMLGKHNALGALIEIQALAATPSNPSQVQYHLHDESNEAAGPMSEKEKRDAEYAETWLDQLKKRVHPLVRPSDPKATVRIAVVDTGAYLDPDVRSQLYKNRLRECRSWLPTASRPGELLPDGADNDGHGTHLASLILTISPNCEVYAAQVFDHRRQVQCAEGNAEMHRAVADAIRYAVDDWKVDIISMSFGFDDEVSEIEEALGYAVFHRKLLLAAASNCGGNDSPSWPANRESVLCIHATNGIGNKYRLTPTRREYENNFATLGSAVQGWARFSPNEPPQRIRRSGTSSATAVAAGIAALVIEVVRRQEHSYLKQVSEHSKLRLYRRKLESLKKWSSMSAVFRLIVGENGKRDGYDYLAPWELLHTNYDHDTTLVERILKAIP